MKYEKAKVTIINLGNEDILTCSGEQLTSCNTNNWQTTYFGYSKPKPKHTGFLGWWGWFWW